MKLAKMLYINIQKNQKKKNPKFDSSRTKIKPDKKDELLKLKNTFDTNRSTKDLDKLIKLLEKLIPLVNKHDEKGRLTYEYSLFTKFKEIADKDPSTLSGGGKNINFTTLLKGQRGGNDTINDLFHRVVVAYLDAYFKLTGTKLK